MLISHAAETKRTVPKKEIINGTRTVALSEADKSTHRLHGNKPAASVAKRRKKVPLPRGEYRSVWHCFLLLRVGVCAYVCTRMCMYMCVCACGRMFVM